MGGDFQVGSNCPEGNYLGIIVQEVVVLGEFHRGQVSWGKLFRGICPGSKSPGSNRLGGYFMEGNCLESCCPVGN